MPDNDDAAQRLIDALLPKIAESLLPQLTAAVEKQIKGVVAKNDDLLGKLATTASQNDKFAELLAAHEKQMAASAALLNPKPAEPAPNKAPLVISRADARSRAKYLAAEAEAKKRGVPLVVSDNPVADAPSADTREYHKTETHLYVPSATMRDRAAFKRLTALAEREHLQFQPVVSLAEVPDADA